MSSLSDAQICNLALDAAGTRATISSLQENSAEGRACARQYGPCLTAMLQAAHWNFARKQAALSVLKDGTVSPSQNVPVPWLYEYAYPSDCVQARFVMPQFQNAPSTTEGIVVPQYWVGPPVRFIVSTDLDSGGNTIKCILTNMPQAVLVYTSLVTDTGLFDDQFVQALAFYIAHRISIPLSGDKTLSKTNGALAQQLANSAQASNGNEGLTVIDNTPDWMRVRGYISDWAYPDGGYFMMSPQPLALIS